MARGVGEALTVSRRGMSRVGSAGRIRGGLVTQYCVLSVGGPSLVGRASSALARRRGTSRAQRVHVRVPRAYRSLLCRDIAGILPVWDVPYVCRAQTSSPTLYVLRGVAWMRARPSLCFECYRCGTL